MSPYILFITYGVLFAKQIPHYSLFDCKQTAQLAIEYSSYNITAECRSRKTGKVYFRVVKK